MRDVVVTGIGLHPFGRFPDKNFQELTYPTIKDALTDSGIPFKDIQMALCGVIDSGLYDSRDVIQQFGFSGVMVHSIVQACSSGTAAFRIAYWAIAAGIYDTALIVGFEKMGSGMLKQTIETGRSHLDVMGLDPYPVRAALAIQKRMREYDEPIEAHAAYSVQCSENAALNHYAHFQKKRTIDEVLMSRMISDPLRLYMCCPNSDGAAAIVMCSGEKAQKYGADRAVRVVAWACGAPQMHDMPGGPGAIISAGFVGGNNQVRRLAAQVYDQAGIGPEDVDVAEVHDPFTVSGMVAIESLGFCPDGEAGRFVMEGNTRIGGRIPVNPDGGLICKGHPLGPSGLSKIIEVTKQLRGDADSRQIPDNPRTGLIHCSGGEMTNMFVLAK
ncbi:thiolase family protein [Chloroflexota bacterium]